MKLQLRLYPNKILDRKCKTIENLNKRHQALAGAMHFHMKQWGGIGLAAPQVGKDIRMLVINTVGHCDDGRKLTMYNPELVSYNAEVMMREGCLSFPEQFYEISRPSEITVKYINKSFEEKEEEFKGLTARAILHEIDHLDGIVFTKYIGDTNG